MASMQRVKKIDQSGIVAFNQWNLNGTHELADGNPKIVPHQKEALDVAAVALPQCFDQFSRRLLPGRVKPLLKLVDYKKHLGDRRRALRPPNPGKGFD
jgi:hypothetical protein